MNRKIIDEEKYQKVLNVLENEIDNENFEKDLKQVQHIDLNHYTKILNKTEMLKIINEYKTQKIIENEINKILVLLSGNPEIVFRLCLEAIKYNVDFIIGIEDFCLAQNKLIIEKIMNIFNNQNIKIKIKLKNLLKDSEIIEIAKQNDKVIIIGNSNLYNRLENEIENLKFNFYGIFEVYSDSNDFKELEETIFEYFTQNQFEAECYDDLTLEKAIKIINKNGYHFCSLLFSNNKEYQEIFKKNIESKYVIINKNPFKEIKFEFEII